MKIQLDSGWTQALAGEFEKPYYQEIKKCIAKDLNAGITVYPPLEEVFHAFQATHWDDLRVVILGQDPYHGHAQAHGLSFSVRDGILHPPSLKNIFKELQADLGFPPPKSGNLEAWAEQGVFLLNAFLTVRAGSPASHAKIGWETFTDQVIQTLSAHKTNIVFILWGNFARSKKKLIDPSKHKILESSHPSPLGAHQGFFGSKPFSQCNEYLESVGKTGIDWGRKKKESP